VTIPDSVTSMGDHTFISMLQLGVSDDWLTRSRVLLSSLSNNALAWLFWSYRTTCHTLGNMLSQIVAYWTRSLLAQGAPSIESDAFDGCTGVTSLGLNTTLLATTDSFMSTYFPSLKHTLKEVTISKNVQFVGTNAFKGCLKVESVSFSASVTTIGESAFSDCTSMASVSLPETIRTIGSNAFKGCTKLETVGIGDGTKYIKEGAFHGCVKLLNFVAPQSVRVIEKNAFRSCTSLRSLILPSFANISNQAFINCTNLERTTVPYHVSISENKILNREVGCALGYGNIYSSGSIYKQCAKCRKGSYRSAFYLPKCQPCQKGKYASTDGAAVCTPCDPGCMLPRQAPQHALTALQVLFATPRDNLSTIFANLAIILSIAKVRIAPCVAAGTFQTQSGAAFCHNCPVGTYKCIPWSIYK
jgi:hypothetical protein